MGNLLAVLSQAVPGQEVVAEADSHVFVYEGGGAAALGGIQIRQIPTTDGVMTAAQVRAALRPAGDIHQPPTRLVCVENTHNRHGGVVWPLEAFGEVAELAAANGLAVHLDGARLFNAALALGAEPADVARGATTVTFCLSKGLGAPVGSVLSGPAAVIERARRWRKALGGGWRQAGGLAAAGLYALDHMVGRLADDHANARTLAEGLAELPGVGIDLRRVQTNIVIFELTSMDAERFLDGCRAQGLLGVNMGSGRLRFVTRYGIEPEHVETALRVCAEVLHQAAPSAR
jgi:threonine aldolase